MEVTEPLGFGHEPQIATIDWPEGEPAADLLKDEASGRTFPVQHASDRPGKAYVRLALDPRETLRLKPSAGPAEPAADERGERGPRNAIAPEGGSVYIANGAIELELPYGAGRIDPAECRKADGVPGPVRRMRSAGGVWRGRSFIDGGTGGAAASWEGRIRDGGALRTVYEYRVAFGHGGRYEAVLTIDAGERFVRIEETFETAPGAQVVWDFAGDDLPETAYLLDPTPGCRTSRLHYRFDQRLARLAGWTQYSQLLDLSDGFAFRFAQGDDAVGFVALDGGDWRGNRHNHAELWMRRWERDDPRTRASMPWDAKADWTGHPERIPARGESVGVPHLNVEAWIVRGHRRFALVVADAGFVLDGGLRRLQTRRGVATLDAMLRMHLAHPAGERPVRSAFRYPNAVLERHFAGKAAPDDAARKAWMIGYLRDMTDGFWNGAGSSHVNCVAGRMIAPCLYLYEYMAESGLLTGAERDEVRARLLFLAYLYASDHYYPGAATMLPVGSDDTTEPTMAGMANQNFYTDIVTVFGTAAQTFPDHPEAGAWRDKFAAMWSRQKAFHTYPDSGVWEESHTYYHHVLHTVLPIMLRRRDDGTGDEFGEPSFRRLVGASLRQLTPRVAEFGGGRRLVPFGDHHATDLYVPLYADYAEAFAPHDPALAGKLAWAYREMNGDRPLPIGEVPVEWEDEYVQGIGYMFRSREPDGGETLLALRSGSAWGHHHNDEASIQLYARGRALIVDSAFGHVQDRGDRKVADKGHSRWTLRDAEPINYLFRFNRGWIGASGAGGRFPFATAFDPAYLFTTGHQQSHPLREPVHHFRTVVRLSPASFLLVDCCDTDAEQIVRFHVPGVRDRADRPDRPEVEAAVGDATLSIVPLRAGAYRLETAEDRDRATGRLATTEYAFHVGRGRLHAFWITVRPAGSAAPYATADGDAYALRDAASETEAAFDVGGEGGATAVLLVRDLKTGETASVPLSDPSAGRP
ncbi:hypothetical protein DLM86_16400 [Paenibacillus flagellatus]|uniref:Heparin-sulfate lyase N-terminal domain-containing protein n=1 Tax=Paenibacillus flagellatus TaxID=2211139 RepID=A0A2V5K294_9BACL|nr:hypothetical protein DLM86_16400 [Paenibacillus flagellatus]